MCVSSWTNRKWIGLSISHSLFFSLSASFSVVNAAIQLGFRVARFFWFIKFGLYKVVQIIASIKQLSWLFPCNSLRNNYFASGDPDSYLLSAAVAAAAAPLLRHFRSSLVPDVGLCLTAAAAPEFVNWNWMEETCRFCRCQTASSLAKSMVIFASYW